MTLLWRSSSLDLHQHFLLSTHLALKCQSRLHLSYAQFDLISILRKTPPCGNARCIYSVMMNWRPRSSNSSLTAVSPTWVKLALVVIPRPHVLAQADLKSHGPPQSTSFPSISVWIHASIPNLQGFKACSVFISTLFCFLFYYFILH